MHITAQNSVNSFSQKNNTGINEDYTLVAKLDLKKITPL